MAKPESTPRTNLVGYQRLVEWYRGAEAHGGKVLCPLVAAVAGDSGVRTLPCDCPNSRRHFLALLPTCSEDGRCLPREAWPWPNSIVGQELQEYYRRSGNGR